MRFHDSVANTLSRIFNEYNPSKGNLDKDENNDFVKEVIQNHDDLDKIKENVNQIKTLKDFYYYSLIHFEQPTIFLHIFNKIIGMVDDLDKKQKMIIDVNRSLSIDNFSMYYDFLKDKYQLGVNVQLGDKTINFLVEIIDADIGLPKEEREKKLKDFFFKLKMDKMHEFNAFKDSKSFIRANLQKLQGTSKLSMVIKQIFTPVFFEQTSFLKEEETRDRLNNYLIEDGYGFYIVPVIDNTDGKLYEIKSFKQVIVNNTESDYILEHMRRIVKHFKLLSKKELWKSFYKDSKYSKPKKETDIQPIFGAVASMYCEANRIDLTPEAYTSSNGKIDFKISKGGGKVSGVEIKKSSHKDIPKYVSAQVDDYIDDLAIKHAFLVIIDIGRGKHDTKLEKLKENIKIYNDTNVNKFYIELEIVKGYSTGASSKKGRKNG